MKTFCLLILSLSLALSAHAQFFEGEIVYQATYKSKLTGVSDDQFATAMGTTQEYYVKGGNYKTVANGSMLQWQLYINVENKVYVKMTNSTSIVWSDGASNLDQVSNVEIHKDAAEVLGHRCDEMIMTCTSGIQKYYYSKDLKADAALYVNHKFGNWSEFIARAHALPLRFIVDTPQFTMECVAVEVKPMKIDDKIFALPADAKLEKSPY